MTDKKNPPSRGQDRPSDTSGGRRPHATIDLKATEVKVAAAATTAAADTAAKPKVTAARVVAPAAQASSTTASAGPQPARGAPRGPDERVVRAAAAPIVAAAAPRAAGGFLTHAAAGVLGGLLALLGSGQLIPGFSPLSVVGSATAVPKEVADRLAALETAQKARDAAPAVAPEVAKRLQLGEAGAARTEELAKIVAALGEAQTRLAGEAKTLKGAVDKAAPAAEVVGRIGKLEEMLSTISAVAAADPKGAGRVPEISRIAGRLADIEEAFTTRLTALRKELQLELTSRMTPVGEAAEAAKAGSQRIDREVATIRSETARISQRSEDLKAAGDRAAQILRTLQEESAGLRVALDAVKVDLEARLKAVAKPGDVAAAVAPIAAKVAALDANVAGVVRSEDDRRTTAERIVLSLELTNLKRAMDRGRGFGPELAEVKRVAGGRIDLSALERFEKTGVPTLADLTRDFRPIIGQMLDLSAEPANAGVLDRLVAGAKSVVRVRRTTAAADDQTAEGIIARMETALREGRLGDVMTESKRLEPRVAAPAKEWLQRVDMRQTVEAALAQVDQSLKAALGAAPKAAAPGEGGKK